MREAVTVGMAADILGHWERTGADREGQSCDDGTTGDASGATVSSGNNEKSRREAVGSSPLGTTTTFNSTTIRVGARVPLAAEAQAVRQESSSAGGDDSSASGGIAERETGGGDAVDECGAGNAKARRRRRPRGRGKGRPKASDQEERAGEEEGVRTEAVGGEVRDESDDDWQVEAADRIWSMVGGGVQLTGWVWPLLMEALAEGTTTARDAGLSDAQLQSAAEEFCIGQFGPTVVGDIVRLSLHPSPSMSTRGRSSMDVRSEDSEKSRQLAVGSSPSGIYKQSNSTTVDDGARSPADAEVVAAMSSTFSTKMGVFNSHSCEGDG